MLSVKPIIGITMGDPAGIGPEVAAKTMAKKRIYDICRPLIVGDANAMKHAVKLANVKLEIRSISELSEAKFEYGTVDVFDLKNVDMNQLEHGKISAMAGNAAFEAVKKVIELALENKIHATVTGPIHKESINLAGHHFAGHTEIYGHLTNTKNFAMLLVSEILRVIHVSTHVSIRQACDLVKKERVLKVIHLLNDACKQFGIETPKKKRSFPLLKQQKHRAWLSRDPYRQIFYFLKPKAVVMMAASPCTTIKDIFRLSMKDSFGIASLARWKRLRV